MSRLSTLSAAALQTIFAQETNKDLLLLVTVYDPVNPSQVILRLCDGFTKRIVETSDEVIYGVTSRGNDYTFLPMEITLPDEQDSSAPRCSITMHDVTRYLIPIIRTINGRPKILIELVLSETPDVSEVSFANLYITNFTYTADKVVADLSMINYEIEPFPQYSFTPVHFPGLF